MERGLIPNAEQRSYLSEAVAQYRNGLRAAPDGVKTYLRDTRKLSGETAAAFSLGYVANPLVGHEQYRGRLALPYMTPAGPVSIRFRAVGDVDKQDRYRTVAGDQPRLYNVAAFHEPGDFIAICEGEMDTMTATQAGIPAVGLPGVEAFKPYMARAFDGYRTIYALADNDDGEGQGKEFAEFLADELTNVRVVLMPHGHDVNSLVVAQGEAALRRLIGVD